MILGGLLNLVWEGRLLLSQLEAIQRCQRRKCLNTNSQDRVSFGNIIDVDGNYLWSINAVREANRDYSQYTCLEGGLKCRYQTGWWSPEHVNFLFSP